MSSRLHGAALAATLLLAGSCDAPRRVIPQEVSAPPLPAGSIVVRDVPQELVPDEPPPPPRATLPDATLVESASSPPIEGLVRVELRKALAEGKVQIETNDPAFNDRLAPLFDGDTESLSRTESINPLILVFKFPEPIKLRTARVFLAGSAYDWLLEAPAGERHLTQGVAERTWSRIDLESAVETDVVRVETLRLERDDYVHVNELELWVEP